MKYIPYFIASIVAGIATYYLIQYIEKPKKTGGCGCNQDPNNLTNLLPK